MIEITVKLGIIITEREITTIENITIEQGITTIRIGWGIADENIIFDLFEFTISSTIVSWV